MGTYKRLQRLWQPSAGKLDSIAAVLSEHWRAATAQSERLFFATPVSWVRVQAVRANALRSFAHHHFTTGGRLIK
jgi:hypothetical protein